MMPIAKLTSSKITWVFVLLIFLLCGCIEEIDFEVPSEFQNTTIILGKIIKGNPSTIEVTVQKLFDFTFTGESFINAKEVFLINQNGEKIEIPLKRQGNYKLQIDDTFDFEINIGSFYGLEVTLLDGQSFKSDLAELIPVPRIERVEQRLVDKEIINAENQIVVKPRVEYRVTTPLIAEENNKRTNIKWDFERIYKQSETDFKKSCYVSGFADADLIQLYSIKGNINPSLNNHLILEQVVSNIMVEGQYVTIIQESLDDNALTFWEQAKELSTNSGTFYESPPGQIFSNFKTTSSTEGGVFGYFYATQHDTMRLFIDSTFINLSQRICPRKRPPCADCCECTLLENSTTDKPSYWTM